MSVLLQKVRLAYARALKTVENNEGIWISLHPLEDLLEQVAALEAKIGDHLPPGGTAADLFDESKAASADSTPSDTGAQAQDAPASASSTPSLPQAPVSIPTVPGYPLYGRLFAVKDNIDVAGLYTTCACPDFAYAPERHAPVVQRLLDAGAICLGKTNLDQFATGLNGTRSPYGAPANPFNAGYISGGSSSGSAVAVARGHVDFALGTDTAGSGRVPAAYNHLIGWKPTRGSWSTTGLFPACRSLDCVTVLTRTLAEAVQIDRLLSVPAPADPYSRPAPAARPHHPLAGPGRPPRVAVLRPAHRAFFGDTEYSALYVKAITHARSLGWEIVEFDYAPFIAAASLLYSGPWVAERLAALENFLSENPDAIHPVVRQIIEGGANFTAVDTFRAIYQLEELRRTCEKLFSPAAAPLPSAPTDKPAIPAAISDPSTPAKPASGPSTTTRQFLSTQRVQIPAGPLVTDGVDALLLPTAPTIYTIQEMEDDPVRKNSHLGHYTNFVNLLDLAALAIPAGHRPDRLPFGITLIAPAWSEPKLTHLASQYLKEPVAWPKSAEGTNRPEGRAGLSEPADEPNVAPTDSTTPDTSAQAQSTASVAPHLTPVKHLHLAVVGAHLEGQPLHHQLTHLGAKFIERTTTAPRYRLYALANTHPPKPGLVRVGDGEEGGAEIEVETYTLTPASLGLFLKQVPMPLALGTLELKSGEKVTGFVCEPAALKDAEEITSFGGWRNYLASKSQPA